ncbi:MAG TPA: Rne/Rng family ribonuclease [Candidatus Pullichristensenella excrementigallinarum]|uniref:Rne/Rng family ribonuclease n=1 Tax=Candidatus Pullichristensenella excrementigallinarum TaxID=2840907 RepID=A0A9D1IAA8_9FIRM|nr:Rne/Rng family ribonuclease [Candidatus Pullichristensenella excrementigallinarum]
MKQRILIDAFLGQTTLALLEEGDLAELYVERPGMEKLTGNIYVGRVQNVLPGMNAAFLDIGLGKNAFLYAGDIRVDTRSDQGLADALRQMQIQKLVRPGQEIMVQVVKEPGGEKGPRVSSHITLPGRYAVLLPTMPYIGVSRRIHGELERTRLRSVAEDACSRYGVGVIVRTAAEGASPEAIFSDVQALVQLWQSLAQRGACMAAPALLRQDDTLIERAVRDMLSDAVDSIRTDDPDTFRRLQEVVKLYAPDSAEKIVLDAETVPLFDRYRIPQQMERALDRRVWLKSGGYLVFDYTEALTVIDVNTGKYVGKRSLSETVFRINCEAAREIARQIRLRDLGGIIVVDFIDMDAPEEREQLLELLRECLKADRTRTNLAGLTSLGLVELTRKKVRQPVHKWMAHSCPQCRESGFVPAHGYLALKILWEIRRRRMAGDSTPLIIRANAAVGGHLLQMGAPAGGKTYVLFKDALSDSEYEMEPVLGTPEGGARLLKR